MIVQYTRRRANLSLACLGLAFFLAILKAGIDLMGHSRPQRTNLDTHGNQYSQMCGVDL